ncbi:beta-N-acetylhexosaminidase [Luteolibacter algae]|uniref:beta-N-acetylhexosaminidase n=1 Tax=Luteolibacter algae TaxID=454151 RepID=A0ABW5DDK5_9BACT
MDGELLLLGVKGAELTVDEAALFKKLQPAGYILFTRNIVSARQVRKLTDDLRSLSELEPIISIDQEGGRVTRTKDIAPVLPSASAFAAKPEVEQIARAGEATAELLRLLGVNLNFAPVLDLDHFPGLQNALRQRCWGRDPQDVINRAGMWNRWTRKRGMLSCGKHFPACGRAQCDPHEDLPSSDATIEEMMKEDVIPYTALMPELDSIMLAHVMFPSIDKEFPASLSKKIVTGWLRGQLGFDRHLVMTDDLDMGAIMKRYGRGEDAKLAIAAGNDLAMICHQTDSAEIAAKSIGEISSWLRDDSKERLGKFRKKMDAPVAWSDARWEAACEKISDIAAKIPEPEVGDEARSAVTEY